MAKKKVNKLGIFLFLLGISFLAISHFTYIYTEEKAKEDVEKYLSVSTEEKKEKEYLGVLEIPKISLKRGFYSLTSKKNNVDKNIQVIETSVMPEEKFSNLILASHSGSSKISYFKNLYKLELKDIAYIYYNDKKYTYELIDIYGEKKDGTITIKREYNQTNLTLITCDKKNKHLQNVYIFKLLMVE